MRSCSIYGFKLSTLSPFALLTHESFTIETKSKTIFKIIIGASFLSLCYSSKPNVIGMLMAANNKPSLSFAKFSLQESENNN